MSVAKRSNGLDQPCLLVCISFSELAVKKIQVAVLVLSHPSCEPKQTDKPNRDHQTNYLASCKLSPRNER